MLGLLKYNASVFGRPVALASRCASTKPEEGDIWSITFPTSMWKDHYKLDKILEPKRYKLGDETIQENPHTLKMSKRTVPIKNMGELEIYELVDTTVTFSEYTAEQRAKESLELLEKHGLYLGRKNPDKNK